MRRSATTEVYLNVYDLSPSNDWLYNIGLGFYHTGIEYGGREYSFGGHNNPNSTGVFSCAPQNADGAQFRHQLLLGECNKSYRELDAIIDQLRPKFLGTDYHVMQRNCNTFTNTFCQSVFGYGIPSYINRMAGWGRCWAKCCPCCVPDHLKLPNSTSEDEEEAVPLVEQSFKAFGGPAHRLDSSSNNVNSNDNNTSLSRNSNNNNSDTLPSPRTRRRLLANAALARIKNNQEDKN